MKQLLKNFKNFFTIQFLTSLNENVFKNVLILLINFSIYKEITINPQLLILISAAIFVLPQILCSYSAGIISDKYNKNYLIRRLKTLEVFLYSFILLSIFTKNIYLLILSLFIVGAQSVFFEIIKYSIIPESIKENDYLKFNGIIITSHFLAWVLGLIISYFCLLEYVGTVTISIILMTSVIMNYVLSKQLNFNEKIVNNSLKVVNKIHFIISDIKNLLFVAKRKYLFLVALGISWFWFVITTFVSQLHHFSTAYLNTNEFVAVSFIMLFAFGIILGCLLCSKIYNDKINIAFTPISAIIITLLIYRVYENNILPNLSISPIGFFDFIKNCNNLRLLLDFFLIGFLSGIYITPLYSFILIKTKNINRGRIFSGINFMNYIFILSSSLVCYILSKKMFLIIDIFLVIAIANLVVGFYILFLLPRSVFFMFARWIFRLAFNVKVKGMENYEAVKNKRIILIANHQSFIDAALLTMFIDENLSFAMAIKSSKKWYFKPFMKLVNCYPIDSTNPVALKSLINLSKSGKKIMIFPEGRITRTGIMMKIYDGPAMIAAKSDALLLPVKIDGAQYSLFSRLKNKVKRKFFSDITLTVLPAEKIEINKGLTARQRRVEAGNQLHKIMTNLFYSASNINETIFEAMLEAKKRFGGHHKIVEDTNFNPQTYNNVILKSFVLGNYVSKFTNQKEYVGVLLPNAVANLVLFLGLHTRDRIPVLLNFSAGVKNVLLACQTTKIRYVITSKLFIEKGKLENMVKNLEKNNIKVLRLEDEAKNITLKDKLLALIYSKFPRIAYKYTTKNLANYDDTAAVLFTSGSEAAPKGVALSHRNLNANRNQLASAYNFLPEDILFCCLPLFHSFGLGATLISLINGTKIFFYPTPLHYRIIPELIYRTNATIMFATNTFLEKYARYANPFDFYTLRIVAIGGEKLTENNRNIWIDKFNVRLIEGYGATECAPLVAFNTPVKYKLGTVGVLAPGLEYRIEEVEGVKEGGKLIIKGDNVFKGYIRIDKPDELDTPKDGWYDTGDIVNIDKDGFVKIIGRVKRFAKIGGEMVSTTMVENEIAKIWPDYTNAVITEKDNKKGERLVVVTNKKDANLQDIITFFKKNELPEISIPKIIKYLEEIPLLGTGKINYVELDKIMSLK